MDKFRFLEWNVYREAKEVFSLVIKFVHRLPTEYRFELGNQMVRSAFSIILNIAEGSGKMSDKELNRFFNISMGSVYETLAGLDVFRDNKFISNQEFQTVSEKLMGISSQLGGFKKKLIKSY